MVVILSEAFCLAGVLTRVSYNHRKFHNFLKNVHGCVHGNLCHTAIHSLSILRFFLEEAHVWETCSLLS